MRAAAAAFIVATSVAASTPARASSGAVDLAATMSGPATASVGQTVAYGVQVTNGGPDEASGTVFTATLSGPAQYTLNIVQPTAKCLIQGSTITCRLGKIPIRGGGVAFDIGVTMAAAGTVVQSFTATANQNDPNPSNNSGTITTAVS
jgi:uncharacterized repeat protein (TIGR01451 family)